MLKHVSSMIILVWLLFQSRLWKNVLSSTECLGWYMDDALLHKQMNRWIDEWNILLINLNWNPYFSFLIKTIANTEFFYTLLNLLTSMYSPGSAWTSKLQALNKVECPFLFLSKEVQGVASWFFFSIVYQSTFHHCDKITGMINIKERNISVLQI